MKSNLKILTSYVSRENLDKFVKSEILPIFIIRNISGSRLISQYSGTILQFKQLSPQTELFQRYRRGEIDFERYQKEYVIGLAGLNYSNLIKRLEYLQELSGANSVVLLGYEKDPDMCHRTLLSDILNRTGLLEIEVREAEI
jgi:uncharacterized protein YeaO (DUF488 family)